ncbi:hypothetical protein ACIPYS_20255 [Kitasatospora sp. NPDC089913]
MTGFGRAHQSVAHFLELVGHFTGMRSGAEILFDSELATLLG